MLQTLKGRGRNKIDGIVTVKLDRMFRNASDCLRNVEAWEAKNIGLHIIDLRVDTSTASGRFFLTVSHGRSCRDGEEPDRRANLCRPPGQEAERRGLRPRGSRIRPLYSLMIASFMIGLTSTS
jgi:DNA invertase Pin-like site-specific DNA recombinase